ncbi:MAG: NUDIX hydrolase [Rhodospirillales bacterium]|nr:NUDIX hydrolase [Rhodospirillales bacterium]MBO6788168.1 NUDIX hydrolase [Rhodospirillales bacterium]
MNEKTDSTADRQAQGPVVRKVPEGDDRERMVCVDCGFVHYDNPRIVTGAVCTWQDKILLCRRAIEPRIGYWTIPAGYLELNESVDEGAKREVVEESGANVDIGAFLGMFEIPRISQIYMIYEAAMISPALDPGPESSEAALFSWDEIPWQELAFPSVTWALEVFRAGDGPRFEIFRHP